MHALAVPGSPEKIQAMIERAARREPLFQTDDPMAEFLASVTDEPPDLDEGIDVYAELERLSRPR